MRQCRCLTVRFLFAAATASCTITEAFRTRLCPAALAYRVGKIVGAGSTRPDDRVVSYTLVPRDEDTVLAAPPAPLMRCSKSGSIPRARGLADRQRWTQHQHSPINLVGDVRFRLCRNISTGQVVTPRNMCRKTLRLFSPTAIDCCTASPARTGMRKPNRLSHVARRQLSPRLYAGLIVT